MNCREVLAKLYEYLDAEVSAAEKKEMDQHLEFCSDCLKKYRLEDEFNKVVKQKLQSPPDVTALKNKVRKEIEKIDIQTQPRNIVYLLGPLIAAAAIAFIIFMPYSKGSDPQAVLKAIQPFAEEHSKCLKGLTQYVVQSPDPSTVKAAMDKLADIPDDIFKVNDGNVKIVGGAVTHLVEGDDPHIDFSAYGENVSIFVVARNSIDKTPFHKVDLNGESVYVGSCPLYQYVIFDCGDRECVAVSKLPQRQMLDLAALF